MNKNFLTLGETGWFENFIEEYTPISLNYWSNETFMEALPIVAQGIQITLLLTVTTFALSLVLGFFWLFLESTPSKIVNFIFYWIREFIRTTPPLIQIFFIYYGLPMLQFVDISFTPFVAGMIALGIHFSTYIAEVYRSGIESVPKGQIEASTALNISKFDKWTKVILPQAIPPTIPMLGNYLIILFKEVPLAATIGVLGILEIARNFGSQNWSYLEPLTIAALLFLLMSYPTALLIRWLEDKINNNDTEAKKAKRKVEI